VIVVVLLVQPTLFSGAAVRLTSGSQVASNISTKDVYHLQIFYFIAPHILILV